MSDSCHHEAGLVDLTSQEGLRLSSVIHRMEGQSSMGWKDKAGPWTKEARDEIQEVTSEVFYSQHFEQQTCGVFPYTSKPFSKSLDISEASCTLVQFGH